MKIFNLFKRKCEHKYKIYQKSNMLQQDSMGYPLRLFICQCKKCGKYKQIWMDVPVEELEELKTGESVLVKWE